MLANVIPDLAIQQSHEQPYRPRPSLAGPDRCLRQLTYMAMGVKGRPLSGRFLILLDDSSWHEELTLNWLSQSGYKIHSRQMQLNCGTVTHRRTPYPIVGHIDALFTDPLNVDRLLEHKAIDHFTFYRYWAGNKVPLDYLTQCTLYLHGLQEIQPDINEGVLLIKNKNTSAYLEYCLHYDRTDDELTVVEVVGSTGDRRAGGTYHGLYGNALAKFEAVEEHLQSNQLPPRLADPHMFPCSYCAYRDGCWADAEAQPCDSTVSLPPDLCLVAEEYLKLKHEQAPIQEQVTELKERLIRGLRELGASEAHGPNIVVRVIHALQMRVDRAALPPALKRQYSKPVSFEILKVERSHERVTIPVSGVATS